MSGRVPPLQMVGDWRQEPRVFLRIQALKSLKLYQTLSFTCFIQSLDILLLVVNLAISVGLENFFVVMSSKRLPSSQPINKYSKTRTNK